MKLLFVFLAGVLIFGSSVLFTTHAANDFSTYTKIDSSTLRINWSADSSNSTAVIEAGGPTVASGLLLGGAAFGAFLLVYSKKSSNQN